MKHNWEYKKLGEVCDLYQPKTISTQQLVEDGKYLVYGANGVIGRYDKYNHEQSEILLTCRGATCGTVNISEPYSWINGNAMVIHRKTDDLLFDFVKYAMKSLDYSLIICGAAQPQITRLSLSPIPIPVPPLPTQQRIVAELDCISGILEKKRQQLKELDNLAQAIFYDMFGDPVENDKGWEVKKLNDIAKIGDGLHGTPEYDNDGTCYFVNGNNLVDGSIMFSSSTKKVSDSEKAKHFIQFNENTLFVSINGSLGKIAYYKGENIILGKSACYIILNDSVNKTYIYSILCSDFFKKYAKSESTGTTILNVSLKSMRNFKFSYPPISLQQQFAKKIEAIERQKALINQSIKEVQTLFDCRMEEYFN